MKIDPVALLQMVPARYRKWIYLAIGLGLFGWSIWQAAGGNWKAALALLGASLASSMARANVTPPAEGTGPKP